MLKLELINDEFIDRYNLLLELYNRTINEDAQEYMPVLKDTSKEQDFLVMNWKGLKVDLL